MAIDCHVNSTQQIHNEYVDRVQKEEDTEVHNGVIPHYPLHSEKSMPNNNMQNLKTKHKQKHQKYRYI